MLNWIWLALILVAILFAAFTGRMEAVTSASIDGAKDAVTLAIGLIGVMAFWLGMMRILADGGLLEKLARGLQPIMKRLFPEVPGDHPAMSAMIMNIASNMLGLGNAATPFGLKAMVELDKLNPRKGTATNAMCLFLAINTSNVAILPLGVIALRAAMNSAQPAAILITTIVATGCSTVIAIIAAKSLQRLPWFALADAPAPVAPEPEPDVLDEAAPADTEETAGMGPAPVPIRAAIWIFVAVFGLALVMHFRTALSGEHTNHPPEPREQALRVETGEALGFSLIVKDKNDDDEHNFYIVRQPSNGTLSGKAPALTYEPAPGFTGKDSFEYIVDDGHVAAPNHVVSVSVVQPQPITFGRVLRDVLSFWLLPVLIVIILLFGMSRQVKVYQSLVEGAKEGFQVAVKIIPYLVAILVAVKMFRASGAMDGLVAGLEPLTTLVGMPAEALPMALLRPLSGSGAYGVMAEIMQNAGPDSFTGLVVSTMQGSTETTFYVLAVYAGAAQVRATRHAMGACLIADLAGVIATVAICWVMFGGVGV